MLVILDGDTPLRAFENDHREMALAYCEDMKSVEGDRHYIHMEECPYEFQGDK